MGLKCIYNTYFNFFLKKKKKTKISIQNKKQNLQKKKTNLRNTHSYSSQIITSL